MPPDPPNQSPPTSPLAPSSGLARRLLVSLSLGALCIFVLTEVLIVWRAGHAIEDTLHGALFGRAQALAALLEIDDDEGRPEIEFEAAHGSLGEYAQGDNAAFAITCQGGHALVRSAGADAMLGSAALDHTDTPNTGADPTFWTHTTPTQRRVEAVALRVKPRFEHIEADTKDLLDDVYEVLNTAHSGALGWECVVVVGLDRAQFDAHKHDMFLISAWTLGGGLFALLVLAVWVVRWGLRPLTALSAALNQLSADRLHPLDTPQITELAQVTSALNLLLSRLSDAFTRERRFMADVTHELRTPITELLTLAQVTLPTLSPTDPHRPDYLDILAAASRMNATLTTMMTLARCDAGRFPIAPLSFDLCALTHQLWTELTPKAAARSLVFPWSTSLPPTAPITTDPNALRAILQNLFLNALTYAPTHTTIDLQIDLTPHTFSLRLTNAAPHLTPTDLPRLFERFWRHDTSRTDAQSGLGLSLSLALAHALGLHLTAHLTPEGCLTMTLSGPRRPSAPDPK